MVKQYVWQTKTKLIEDDLRDWKDQMFQWRLRQHRLEDEGSLWPEQRAYPRTIGAYEGENRDEIERELPWLSVEAEEEWRKSPLEAERQAREWLPWIGLSVATGGLPTAAQAFGAASKISPKAVRMAAKGGLGVVYPEQWIAAGAKAGLKGAAKLVEPIKEKVASYMQQLEAHRMSNVLGWTKDEYTKLAKEITGKESMTKMTQTDAEKFITAILERGGSRDIVLPAERGIIGVEAKAEASSIAKELMAQLGKPVKEIPKTPELGLEKKGIIAKGREAIDNYTQRTWRLERTFDKLDGYPKSSRYNVIGGKFSQVFYNAAYKAENAALRGKTFAMDSLNTMLKESGINLGQAMSRTANIGGVDVPLGTRLGILAHSINPDNLRHITSLRGNRVNPKFASEVLKSVTPDEQKLLSWFLKFWQDDTAAVGKSYEIANSGKKFPAVKDYVPMMVKDPKRYIPIDETLEKEAAYHFSKKWPSGAITKGFTRARSAKADQPIELDIFKMFTQRLQEVEHYKAFAPLARDWGRILNDRSFRESFINKVGRPTYNVIEQWTKDVAATNPLAARNWEERIAQMLRVNATTAVLGWNVTTMLKQFPSYMIGAARIGELNALKGLYLSIVDFKGTNAIMKQLSPQIDKRIMARELAENDMYAKLGESIFNWKNARKLFMVLTTTMDRTVVRALYRGAYDDGFKKLGSEKLAAGYAEKTIRETQPFFSIKDIPELWRAQGRAGELTKVLTMFQNQLNQYWNYYRHTVFGGWQQRQMSTPEALKQFMEGFIVPALMIGAVTRSDIARTPKEAVTDVASMVFSSVPVMGQFITAGLQGYRDSQGFITTEILERAQAAAYELSKGEWEKFALIMPEMAGYATGVPVGQPRRTIKAILDKGSDVFDDWLQLIWGSYTREQVKGGELVPKLKLE